MVRYFPPRGPQTRYYTRGGQTSVLYKGRKWLKSSIKVSTKWRREVPGKRNCCANLHIRRQLPSRRWVRSRCHSIVVTLWTPRKFNINTLYRYIYVIVIFFLLIFSSVWKLITGACVNAASYRQGRHLYQHYREFTGTKRLCGLRVLLNCWRNAAKLVVF